MYPTVSLGLHDVNFPIRWWTWGSVQTSESLPLCYEQMDLWLLPLAWLMLLEEECTQIQTPQFFLSYHFERVWWEEPCEVGALVLLCLLSYSKLGHLSLACADADRSLFWNLPFASLQIILAFNIHFWHLHFPHSISLELFYLYPS